ncbi:hypothetical protein J8J27_33825, partial [Mycobacterium tuberculosis]|nr:hypothetical protein [Mycobacterium tuberculosis]
MRVRCRRLILGLLLALPAAPTPAGAVDAGFARFVAALWPEVQAAGVSRETFERETRGLEPDES